MSKAGLVVLNDRGRFWHQGCSPPPLGAPERENGTTSRPRLNKYGRGKKARRSGARGP